MSGLVDEAAEVVLWVVDEAVLTLAGYRLPSPLDLFYTDNRSHCSEDDTRRLLLLRDW